MGLGLLKNRKRALFSAIENEEPLQECFLTNANVLRYFIYTIPHSNAAVKHVLLQGGSLFRYSSHFLLGFPSRWVDNTSYEGIEVELADLKKTGKWLQSVKLYHILLLCSPALFTASIH